MLGVSTTAAVRIQNARANDLLNGAPNAALRNRAFVTNTATTNGQGAGGPTIIALAALNVKASGVFYWAVSGDQAAAAQTETVTWVVGSQTNVGGTAVLTTTNPAFTTATNGCIVATGGAGTGIVITAGGGGPQTLTSQAQTIGTAAVGSLFSASGMSATVLGQGASFILTFSLTSTSNRIVSGICIDLYELP